MAAVAHSLRVPESLEADLNREIARRGEREWTTGVLSMLDEAVRISRTPGIVFVDGRGERRAAVAFSGLEVWEIIATWREAGKRWDGLREAYPELSDLQLRAALSYYAAYPAEIDARLAREAAWTPERTYAEFPFMDPASAPPQPGERG